MLPQVAAVIAFVGIVALFRLDRDGARVSKAIWVPFVWLLIASSRPISSWLALSGPVNNGDAYVEGSPLDRNALTLILIVGLVVLLRRRREAHKIVSVNGPVILFFAYCMISVVWADYPVVLLKRWIRGVADIVMVLVILTETDWVGALRRVVTRLGFILIPLSILFIRFFPALGRAYSRGGSPMWTGVGTDKNALGMICMLFGTFLLWRGLSTFSDKATKQRTRQLVTIGILFGMILYLLLVVNSQTALSCFAMAGTLIVFTAISPTFCKPLFVTSLVAAMLIASFSVLFLGVGGGALSSLGRDASLTGRTDVWRTVLPYAVNPLIGAGYENFWVGERVRLFEHLLGGLNQAHNGYIELYLNIGWIGLMLLGGIIVSGYRNIVRHLDSDREITRLKLAFFLIALIYNFTEASFKMQSPVWIMFLWAVMLTPVSSRVPQRAEMSSCTVKELYFGESETHSGQVGAWNTIRQT